MSEGISPSKNRGLCVTISDSSVASTGNLTPQCSAYGDKRRPHQNEIRPESILLGLSILPRGLPAHLCPFWARLLWREIPVPRCATLPCVRPALTVNVSPTAHTSVAYIASVAPTEGGTLVPMSGSGGHMVPASFNGCPTHERRHIAPRCPVCDDLPCQHAHAPSVRPSRVSDTTPRHRR
jgi:hypothetical protein